MVVKALGQEPLLDLVAALPELEMRRGQDLGDRPPGAASIAGLFAGGDCLRSGGEIVDAVEDGKIAAAGYTRRSRTAGQNVLPRQTRSPHDRSVDRILRSEGTQSIWLASGPPTNSEYQVRRAFDAGWGGAVWKTLADEPIVNVSSRYGAIDYDGRKVMGLNNIELITDRPLEINLKEIARVKKGVSRSGVFVSLMVESKRKPGTR